MAAILPLEAGTLIGGHYSIEGLINTGGFGSVYRGRALNEGDRLCAIKETYDVTPAARRQALIEAAVLFTVKNEHLPQVYDAFEEKGRFYLVMQLIEGQNGAQMVKAHGGPFSEQEVLNWFLPVADVLQELHARNPPVLHRDIKPANIILTPQGQAVLVDFGLTRLYDPSTQTQTIARAVSEGFSPLEQYISQTSPRSDIYALAATMYFMLTARVPPASVARSVQDGLVLPRQINPHISPGVESALLRALAVNAELRQASMQEFARALRNPGFSGYADPTIAQTRSQPPGASAGPVAPSASTYSRTGQTQGYQPAPPVLQPAPRTSEPVPGWSSAPSGPAQPYVGRSGRVIHPPAGGALGPAYPPAPRPPRALPRPARQGFLWGVLQGVISALLLLLFTKPLFFSLGIAEGLLFYLLAGFFTTRRGGAVTRSLIAGFWAGVVSTITYWFVLIGGVLIEALALLERIKERDPALSSGEALQRAINQVKLSLLGSSASSTVNQTGRSTLILLLVGLACALGFAFIGGLIGLRSDSRQA